MSQDELETCTNCHGKGMTSPNDYCPRCKDTGRCSGIENRPHSQRKYRLIKRAGKRGKFERVEI